MTVSTYLKMLGLPRNAHWDEAHPRLKANIVAARRVNDDETASVWSMIAAHLKRNLHRTCDCGATIAKTSRQCRTCWYASYPHQSQ